MQRYVVLFAREPVLEARRKGFQSQEAARLFEHFARGWRDAARRMGARFVLATPPEDRAAWRGCLAGAPEPLWIAQRGGCLGARLEDAARHAAALGGHAILVGGDVAPAEEALAAGFDALERGADAVFAPSPDGGISLIGLGREDLDLLAGIRERRRTLSREMLAALADRGRRVSLLEPAADVDGKTALRLLLRGRDLSDALIRAGRLALETDVAGLPLPSPPLPAALHGPLLLRGPPLAA